MFKEGWEKDKRWFYASLALLIVIVIFSIFIRTANIPQLKDVTTGNYTLGPDLDPFLYLRLAGDILGTGSLPVPDYTRYLGLGGVYKNLISFDIAYLYKFLSIFTDFSLEYVAIIFPVIFFALSIVTFFFFVREIFWQRNEFEKNGIAILSSLLYAVMPAMQHRTTAGIPELESVGIVFFWLSLFLFLRAWRSEGKTWKINQKYFFAALSGISTALMIFHWGGFRFIFLSLSLTTLVMFLMGKIRKEETIIYSIWFLISDIALALYTSVSLAIFDITTSTPALFVFVILIANLFAGDFIGKKARQITKKEWISNEVATILTVTVGGFLVLLLIRPEFTINIFGNIIERLLHPYGEIRTQLTVAENIQPYMRDVIGMLGKGFFWLMFFGTFFIFYEIIKHFNKKDKLILSITFLIFLTGFVFSRYSSDSVFNGTSLVSQTFYFGTMLLFLGSIIYIYVKNSKENINESHSVNFNYVFLLALVLLMILASKGAIRLLFISSPTFTIPVAFLVVGLFSYWTLSKDEFWKTALIILFAISLVFSGLSFVNFEKQTAYGVKATVPSSYTFQWQKAMDWVRDNTPENAIFVHWWDYGYWVQSIGQRPTVTDGGHLIGYWDHLTGRYLLTTPNPASALSIMKSYNVSYLLIDSTDLGKYPAYSRIGSDESGEDRFGSIAVMPNNPAQTQINENGTTKVYSGGIMVDEDILLGEGANRVFLPYSKSVMGGIILKTEANDSVEFSQPLGAFFYNEKQYIIPIRYLYYNGNIIDFKAGVNTTVMVIPAVTSTGTQVTIDYAGAVIYMSPKVSQSLFTQLYLFDDVNKRYPTVTLAHSEPNEFVTMLNAQGANVGEFVYFSGFQGPIKIWKVEYPSNIVRNEEFLKKSGEYAELDNLTFSI